MTLRAKNDTRARSGAENDIGTQPGAKMTSDQKMTKSGAENAIGTQPGAENDIGVETETLGSRK